MAFHCQLLSVAREDCCVLNFVLQGCVDAATDVLAAKFQRTLLEHKRVLALPRLLLTLALENLDVRYRGV